MIEGIGVDIELVKHFKGDHALRERIFTQKEIQYCKNKREPEKSFAGKFCAKEAVMKASKEDIAIDDIEILHEENKPVVYIKGKKQNIYCSISHTDEYAIAFVVKGS